MKKLLVIGLILFLVIPAGAGTWCQWSGTKGENCQEAKDGVIMSPSGFPIRTESIAKAKGVYPLTVTEPTLGANQVKGAEVWAFANDAITKTWAVRDLSATEIDEKTAGPMGLSDYYIWKTLIKTGVITQAQAQTHLPKMLLDAYVARKKLLGD